MATGNHNDGAKPNKPDEELRFYTAAEIAKMTPPTPASPTPPCALYLPGKTNGDRK